LDPGVSATAGHGLSLSRLYRAGCGHPPGVAPDSSGLKLWNGKVGLVQVTDTTAQAMEIRLLLSADDASLAWDLRCEVREKMIAFVQAHYPESLPKIRGALQQGETGGSEGDMRKTRGRIHCSDSA
jgi:hypothetical protein